MRKSMADIEGAGERQPIAASAAVEQYHTLPQTRARPSSSSPRAVVDDELLDSEASPYLPCLGGHYPCLDVVRILCVWLACVDHAGTKFGVWNTMYVQSWVLQYLFYVCGFCFSLSSRDIFGYNGRLFLYFIVGACFNCAAWTLAGRNWKANIFGAVFQFWFVFGLMVFLFVLTPLKRYLKAVREERAREASPRDAAQGSGESPGRAFGLWTECGKGLLAILLGCLAIKACYEFVVIPLVIKLFAARLQVILDDAGDASKFWGVDAQDINATSAFIHQFFSDSEVSVGNLFIAFVFPMVSKKLPLTLWIVLVNTYLHKCVLYRSQTTRLLNSFDCTLMGVTFFYCGFAGRRLIGEYLTRYWFLFLFGCSMLWRPGMFGRLDESPPLDLATRASYNGLEFCFAVLFFTSIERMVDPKIFSKDRLQFLGYWSLLLFLVHKFLVILVKPMEYWLIMFSLIPLCKLVAEHGKPKERTDAKKPVDV